MLLRDKFGGFLPLQISIQGQKKLEKLQLARITARLNNLLPQGEIKPNQLVSGVADLKLTTYESKLKERIAAYLLSERWAEMIPRRETAYRLAGKLVGRLTDLSVSQLPRPEELTTIIESEVETEYLEDVTWLADALHSRLVDELERIKVNFMFNKLTTRTAEDFDEVLSKKVKGELWQLQDDFVAVSRTDYQTHRKLFSPGKVRTTNFDLKLTGMVPVLNQMEEELMPTQIKSLGLTLLVVMLILMIIFRFKVELKKREIELLALTVLPVLII
jgi:predicted RND superfamily exporter protein